jgi:predicted metal-binding membrane protein
MPDRVPGVAARAASDSPPDPGVVAGRDPASAVTYAVLLVIAAAAWVQVLSSTMNPDDMRGMHMASTPTVGDGLVYVGAWAAMMAAMMLPSAAPMIGLYAATQRSAAGLGGKVGPVVLFTLMYLALWTGTGVPIYLASVALGVVTADALAYGIAGVLVVAGLFQVSPLKQVCLRHCRSPVGFLLGHWRAGWRGALTMGSAHAVYCLGCCWALMVVLVAAGAMGLSWVLLIAAVVAAEKLLPHGEWIARVTGVALMLLGVAIAVRPDLAGALRAGGHAM